MLLIPLSSCTQFISISHTVSWASYSSSLFVYLFLRDTRITWCTVGLLAFHSNSNNCWRLEIMATCTLAVTCVYIYDLLYDAVINSDYIAQNNTICEWWIWKDVVRNDDGLMWANIPVFYLYGLRKLRQISVTVANSSWNLNPGPPENEVYYPLDRDVWSGPHTTCLYFTLQNWQFDRYIFCCLMKLLDPCCFLTSHLKNDSW